MSNNAYGFVLESREKAVFVVDVDQIEKAVENHRKEWFQDAG